MATVTAADIERMTDGLFIEGPWHSRGSSRFWVLLVLAAVIATAGVVADSTATVIGAMIVAPLMTPILGCALSVVLADRRHLVRSVALVLSGAALVVAIAFLIGLVAARPDGFASNSQVTARISPRLIDLLAAVATGTVGAFALVRSDISDALPGVAIAISLVPPLSVVGLLLQTHRYGDAAQAGLLFGTNVAAIIATGTVVFLVYRVRQVARSTGYELRELTGRTLATVGLLVVLVAVPLTFGSIAVAQDALLAAQARPVAIAWGDAVGEEISGVEVEHGTVIVTALGMALDTDLARLRRALDDAGMAAADLTVNLVAGGTRLCPAGTTTCHPPQVSTSN